MNLTYKLLTVKKISIYLQLYLDSLSFNIKINKKSVKFNARISLRC